MNKDKKTMKDGCNEKGANLIFNQGDQFSFLFNEIKDAVFVKDDCSRLVMVNDSFCELFQLDREKVIGKTLAEHVAPHEREGFLSIDQKVLDDGIENISEESLTLKGRPSKMLSTRKSRFIDATGRKFLVGVTRDVSKNYKAKDLLKKNEAELQALNETKDKMFSIIAHDLRSPFSNIIGLSDFLLDDIENIDEKSLRKFLGSINTSAKNSLSLLDNLLNWAKTQTGQLKIKIEKFGLKATLNEVINQASTLAEVKKISLKSSIENISIHSDVDMLKLIVRNLLSNAIKFTPENGTIEVETLVDDKNLKIEVSDSGVGMSQDVIDNLFLTVGNKTTLGTANEKGSGIGLLLCKEFAQKLGGTLNVKSQIDKGSSFILSIPISSK